MTKEIPILFSPPMVQAIRVGRKTMTRRLIKPQPKKNGAFWGLYGASWSKDSGQIPCVPGHSLYERNPYGKPGDLLWVKEEHYKYGCWIDEEGVFTKTGKQKKRFIAHTDDVVFEKPVITHAENTGWHKRLGRFMFKKDARIWLEVTNVRVERLHDISEQDAIAEGIEPVQSFDSGEGKSLRQLFKNYLPVGYSEMMPNDSFMSLWENINGAESMKSNPWVWVVEFKVISKTGKP